MERYANHAGWGLERRYLLTSLPYFLVGVVLLGWAAFGVLAGPSPSERGGIGLLILLGCLFSLIPIVGPLPALARTPRSIRVERDRLVAEWSRRTEEVPFAAITSTDTERTQFVQGYRYAGFVPVPAAIQYDAAPDAGPMTRRGAPRGSDRTLYLTEANLQRVRAALETYRVESHQPGPDDPLPPEEIDEQTARDLGEV